jgi:hypothetical protein
MYKHYNSRQNNGIYIILIVTGKLNQIQSSKYFLIRSSTIKTEIAEFRIQELFEPLFKEK